MKVVAILQTKGKSMIRMGGWELDRGNGRVHVMLMDERPWGWEDGEIPDTGLDVSRRRLEPEVVRTDEVSALYRKPPIIHVVEGVDGIQSVREGDGRLNVFVSPETHRRMEHEALLMDHGAKVWPEVRWYAEPRRPR